MLKKLTFVVILSVFLNVNQARVLLYGCNRFSYDFFNMPNTSNFYFIGNELLDASNARRLCIERGTDLVSVMNKAERDFIYSFLKQTKYTYFHTSGIRLGNDFPRWQNADIDNNIVFYANWYPNNTFQYDGIEAHLVIVVDNYGGMWIQVPKTFLAAPLCMLRC